MWSNIHCNFQVSSVKIMLLIQALLCVKTGFTQSCKLGNNIWNEIILSKIPLPSNKPFFWQMTKHSGQKNKNFEHFHVLAWVWVFSVSRQLWVDLSLLLRLLRVSKGAVWTSVLASITFVWETRLCLMIYCVLNNNTFKLLLKEHMVILDF